MKTQYYFVAAAVALAGCKSEGPEGEDLVAKLARETMCVVAAERFTLYDDAKRHLEHGLAAAREQFTRTGKAAGFPEAVHDLRTRTIAMPKEYHQHVLATMCDRQLTKAEFEEMH